MVSSSINQAIEYVNSAIDLVVGHAFYIGVALISLYYLSGAIDIGSIKERFVPTQSDAPPRRSEAELREEMHRVREQQQAIAEQRALEAEKKRKEKEAKEKERKNKVALPKPKPTGSGDRLGGSTSGGYNPLQPWNSGTGGYRAPRRTVRRG